VTTGASSDLARATEIARRMVTEYGMSPELGLVIFSERGNSFLGTEFGASKNYSEAVAGKIDEAITTLIHEAEERTTALISSNQELMDKIAAELLKKEVLNQDEFEAFFPKTKVVKKKATKEKTE
jgi:cell division protease FtsH